MIVFLLLASGFTIDPSVIFPSVGILISVGSAFQILRDSKNKIAQMENKIESDYVRKSDHERLSKDVEDLKKTQADTQSKMEDLRNMVTEINVGVKMLLAKYMKE